MKEGLKIKNMKPNIIFLVIDALPAYRCYDKNKTSLTPNIDSLINRGVKFEQVVSSADFTPTSFGSMFTATYPFRNAIRGGLWIYKLKSNAVNCIKILKENGYNPLAILPGITSMQGIYEPFEKDNYDIFEDRLHNSLVKRITTKLKSDELKKPWIYFLHLMDAHKPIFYTDEFKDERFGKDEYDKMLSSVDFHLGKILECIDYENTLVVLTADHGDFIRSVRRDGKNISLEHKSLSGTVQKIGKITPDFLYPLKIKIFLIVQKIIAKVKIRFAKIKLSPYEKRNMFDSRSNTKHVLFDELIKVPLIFAGYGISKKLTIVNQVRTVDIFPTIFDIVGLKNKLRDIDGISLKPFLDGGELKENPAYIETSINYKNSEEGGYGLRTSKYKYFHSISEKNKKVYLYDLEDDPFEQNNIVESNSKIVNEMEIMLKNIKKGNKLSEKDLIRKNIALKRKKIL